MLSNLVLLMSLLLQQISQGGISSFLDFYCVLGHLVLFNFFPLDFQGAGIFWIWELWIAQNAVLILVLKNHLNLAAQKKI